MTEELRQAIKKSYSVFSKYQAKLPLDVCTDCCMTVDQTRELVNMSTQQIPFKLLYEYNTAAKSVLPKIEEFKHFLPRFLELTAELQFLHHSAELVLSRFEYYSIGEWTQEERETIQCYANELFKYLLTVYPLPELETIDSLIIMLYKAQVNIKEVLKNWSTIETRSSVLHLSDLVCNGFKGANNETLSSGFADNNISKLVYNWLNSDFELVKLKTQIEEIIMQPKKTQDWKLNELNWTYEKLNELSYKLEEKQITTPQQKLKLKGGDSQ